MAETTLSAILTRFAAVLEAEPLNLKPSLDAFSHGRQPNTLLDQAYYLEDGGLQDNRPVGNRKAARIDRVVIYFARKLSFDGVAARQAMSDQQLTAERYLKADGPDHGYHVEMSGGRRITRPRGGDFLIGSLALTVDYDVDEEATD